MATLTSPGIGSGLDVNSIVTGLVDAERQPVANRLDLKEAEYQAKLSALGSLKSALSSFQSSFSSLKSLSGFRQRTVSVGDESLFSASVTSTAPTGKMSVEVRQLAAAQSLATRAGEFGSLSDVVGGGTLTFKFGTASGYADGTGYGDGTYSFAADPDKAIKTVSIAAGSTLEEVRDAINAADIGVRATIVDDGSGANSYRLLLSVEDTGAANNLEITVADDDGNNTDGAGLSRLALQDGATNLIQNVAGQDAKVIVDGLTIYSDTNEVTAIPGVTLSLKKEAPGSPTSMDISLNTAEVTSQITEFVNSYNDLIQTIDAMTSYDAETETAGVLNGDASLRIITGQLRNIISDRVEYLTGTYDSLAAIGIVSERDGTLSLDSSKLDAALSSDLDEVVKLFAAVGTPSDPDIEYLSADESVEPGEYAVNVTALATQGALTAGSAISSLVVDTNNDTLALKVDGVASGTITLTQKTYASNSELAQEIQNRINGSTTLTDAGITVEVTVNASNQLVITSKRYGSASKVEITSVDTNTTSTLGLSVGVGTDGVDVAGSIGGSTGTGSGQTLTAKGISIEVTGGATGSRGTLTFTRGYADRLNTLLDQLLDSDGVVESRIDGLNSRIEDLNDDRERLDERMQALEARLYRQFSALDTLMIQMNATSQFLSQQLSILSKLTPGQSKNG